MSTGCVQLAETAMMTIVGDQAVLLDSPGGNYFSLDETGRVMLEVALSTHEVKAAVRVLESRFDASESRIGEDFSRLIQELIEAGLVTRS